jgi:hypothetical protein
MLCVTIKFTANTGAAHSQWLKSTMYFNIKIAIDCTLVDQHMKEKSNIIVRGGAHFLSIS